MPKLKELREKRGGLIAEAQALLDVAETGERDLTAEESEQWDKLHTEQGKIGETVKREERQQEANREAAAKVVSETTPGNGGASSKEEREKRELRAFGKYLTSGILSGEGMEEFRALQADADISGGYLVAPELFVAELIQAVDNEVFIRGLATKHTLTQAASLGVPTLDTDVEDATWTSEIGTVNEDTALAFGKRSLEPHKLSKLVKISMKLLRLGAIAPEQLVMARLAYKFGVTEEKAFMTGSGAQRPLGIFIASDDGISTGRDVSTDNTSTAITADGLINVKYFLKSQYHGAAQWIFHRDAMKMIAKFKDGEGQYLWQPGLQEGQPDRLLSFPVNMSEYVPNTFETTLYVGMLGDYSKYWIVDSLSMEVQRLVELYAANDQVGFIARAEVDGMPVLEEAFVRIQLA